MRIGILFWIYKDIDVCIDRARLLRRLNPELPIYTLFGGEASAAAVFETRLKPYIDDFFLFPGDHDSEWKWVNGDLVVAQWFRDRGRALAWDTIFVAQWDMVMLAPASRLLANLKADELLLPGLRPVSEVEDWWYWARRRSPQRSVYDTFLGQVATRFPAPASPLCCNFITAALPRSFLERYQSIPSPEFGFLEYKVPIYAQCWGFSFCSDHPFNPIWLRERPLSRFERAGVTLHAEKRQIHTIKLSVNALLPWGKRVFHPYTKVLPAWVR